MQTAYAYTPVPHPSRTPSPHKCHASTPSQFPRPLRRHSPARRPSKHRRPSTIHILGAASLIALVLLAAAAMPILILVFGKETGGGGQGGGVEVFGRGHAGKAGVGDVVCATCAEIEAQNPKLLYWTNGGVWMGCIGPGSRGSIDALNAPNVTFGGMKRCWVREKGLDEWLRPVGWGRADVVTRMEEEGFTNV